ncbi:AlpA family phage regulatory protein [Neisseria bacilliformis]|nr:AlpA family phage regulatory protein [Neisseria bacilliformis]
MFHNQRQKEAIMTNQVETFLRIGEVKKALGVTSSEAVYSRMREGNPRYDPDMPKSVKVGKRATAWLASEIAAYQQILISRSREAGK